MMLLSCRTSWLHSADHFCSHKERNWQKERKIRQLWNMMTYFRKLFHRFKNHSPTHIFSIFTALSASPQSAPYMPPSKKSTLPLLDSSKTVLPNRLLIINVYIYSISNLAWPNKRYFFSKWWHFVAAGGRRNRISTLFGAQLLWYDELMTACNNWARHVYVLLYFSSSLPNVNRIKFHDFIDALVLARRGSTEKNKMNRIHLGLGSASEALEIY